MTSANHRRISAVLVSYRTGPVLLDTLKALNADPDVAEIILVDNGNPSEDRLLIYKHLTAAGKGRQVQGHGNVGFARACNYGATLASGTHLWFLNPDAIPMPGTAAQLASEGEGLARPWLTGGALRDTDGIECRGARRGELTLVTALLRLTPFPGLFGMAPFNRHHEPYPDAPMAMPTLSGANMMTDRKSFEHLEGFDEAYFLHVEDVEICRRARSMGGSVIFTPDADVQHVGSTSDVPTWRVEGHKFDGLMRFLWTGSPGLVGRIAIILLAPVIALAMALRLLLGRFGAS